MTTPIVIPCDQLAPATLRNLVEEFVSRDGTDYGPREVSLQDKATQVLNQVHTGEVVVVFDTANDSCNLMTRAEVQQMHLDAGGKV